LSGREQDLAYNYQVCPGPRCCLSAAAGAVVFLRVCLLLRCTACSAICVRALKRGAVSFVFPGVVYVVLTESCVCRCVSSVVCCASSVVCCVLVLLYVVC
jgi:hypothetical protein